MCKCFTEPFKKFLKNNVRQRERERENVCTRWLTALQAVETQIHIQKPPRKKEVCFYGRQQKNRENKNQ